MDYQERFLKETHGGDLWTLLKIYWCNKPIFKSQYFWISFSVALLTLILKYWLDLSYVEILRFLSEKATTIIPSILGFNLGAYVLLISLNSTNILADLTEPELEKGENFSFYQKMSGVFAFSLLLQVTSLVLGIIVSAVIRLGKNVFIGNPCVDIVNASIMILLSFVLVYSIVLIGQIVLNVFNFGQVLHFFIRIETIENEESK